MEQWSLGTRDTGTHPRPGAVWFYYVLTDSDNHRNLPPSTQCSVPVELEANLRKVEVEVAQSQRRSLY